MRDTTEDKRLIVLARPDMAGAFQGMTVLLTGCASHLIDRVVFMRLHSTRIGDEVHLPEATRPV